MENPAPTTLQYPQQALVRTLIWKAILDPNFHRIDNTNFQISVLKICVKTSKIN